MSTPLTRRGWFGVLSLGWLARLVPSTNVKNYDYGLEVLDTNRRLPTTGTMGGIERATFHFWRNRRDDKTTTQSFDDLAQLKLAMADHYNACSRGLLRRALR